MRDYQRQRENPYLLPEYLYKSIKYAIKDYDRILQERLDILHSSPSPRFDTPKGTDVSSPTDSKALRLAALSKQLECIDQALVQVPHEYRRGVFNEARYGGGFPGDAGIATYKRWKQRFVYWTAKNMKLW